MTLYLCPQWGLSQSLRVLVLRWSSRGWRLRQPARDGSITLRDLLSQMIEGLFERDSASAIL